MQVEPSLDELKRVVPILPLAASRGFVPRKIGKGEYVVFCPVHKEDTPSCHINIYKNVFHCKGCGNGGSVFDWLMVTEKLDFAGIVKRLKEEYVKFQSVKSRAENEPEPIDIFEPRYQKALALLVDYYHNNFKAKKEGAGFMLKRGLIYGELVDDFKIGLSDGSLIKAINDPEILQSLVDLGILKIPPKSPNGNGGLKGLPSTTARGAVEHFAGRVIFPVIDENGLIVQIYGRNISSIGTKHMLLSGAPLGLFNPRALIAGEVILCESIIDALSIMAMGFRNVVATLSANGLKDDLFEKIVTSGVRKVFIAFDNDNVGNIAAGNLVDENRKTLSLSEKLIECKIESFRIIFDENSDANDLLRKYSLKDKSSPSTIDNGAGAKRKWQSL